MRFRVIFFAVAAFGILIILGCALYVLFGLRRFALMHRLKEGHPLACWLLCLGLLAPLGLYALRRPVAALIVLVHLALFWMAADLLGKLLWRGRTLYLPGLIALLACFAYLAAGWYLCHHVVETDYRLVTDKDLGGENLRIVQIADSHLGMTLDGEAFARQMERVGETRPDLVVVTGDFVDDDSKRTDMERSAKALGEIRTTYGVFFCFGNHDKGYGNYRDFSTEDLRECLEQAGVTILEDETVALGDGVLLTGRQDRSEPGRAPIRELVRDLPEDRYHIVLDHQPNDYEAEAAAGVDLVLSGHTHGGQMIPIGPIGIAMGANDRTYGLERRGGTDFIVTSGISDWAIPFKTGTVSEFVVIDIRQDG